MIHGTVSGPWRPLAAEACFQRLADGGLSILAGSWPLIYSHTTVIGCTLMVRDIGDFEGIHSILSLPVIFSPPSF